MIDDFERCPNCHKPMVYAGHHNGKWHIFCWACGFKTGAHDTHSEARDEWDKERRRVESEGTGNAKR